MTFCCSNPPAKLAPPGDSGGSARNSLSYAMYAEDEATDCAGTKTCGFRWTFMKNDLASINQ